MILSVLKPYLKNLKQNYKMKLLVIGLGSMGKRRIRCLKKLGFKKIYGFDKNPSRVKKVGNRYKIETFFNFKEAFKSSKPDIFIISTPPDKHYYYAKFAANKNIDCFMEASVEKSTKTLNLFELQKKTNTIIAPSCTMKYFKAPKIIKNFIKKKLIGDILSINYQIGQYLPDWHPWENIKDFYVSKKKTGACREIVPFELTWIMDIFGLPKVLNSFKGKLSNLKMKADDFYNFNLKFPKNIIANITVEVLSRVTPTRNMIILGSKGKIFFNNEDKMIKLYKTSQSIKTFKFDEGKSEKGYVYSEKPYVDEMRDFIKAVRNKKNSLFPHDLKKDANILKVLEEIEKNC